MSVKIILFSYLLVSIFGNLNASDPSNSGAKDVNNPYKEAFPERTQNRINSVAQANVQEAQRQPRSWRQMREYVREQVEHSDDEPQQRQRQTEGENRRSGQSTVNLERAGTLGQTGTSGQTVTSGQTGSSGQTGTSGQTGSSRQTGTSGQTSGVEQTGSSGRTGNAGQTSSSGQTGTSGQTGSSGQTVTSGQTGSSGQTGNLGRTGNAGQTSSAGQTGASGHAVQGVASEGNAITRFFGRLFGGSSTGKGGRGGQAHRGKGHGRG